MVLFTICALMHLLIGVLTPILVRADDSVTILFLSTRTDTELYGATPGDLVAAAAKRTALGSRRAGPAIRGAAGGTRSARR